MSNPRLAEQLADAKICAELSGLLITIGDTCKSIAQSLRGGELAGVLGVAGGINVQGEEQKMLDVLANDMLKERLLASPQVRGIASEEEPDVVAGQPDGKYLVIFDPLDGSSNIDINGPVGTIFSVLKTTATGPVSEAEFLQKGREQVAAGYVMYGSSALLALTLGNGTDLYTLDPHSSNFVLTRAAVRIDEETSEFAINMSNQRHWRAPMQRYINELVTGVDGPRERNFNMRWFAAMVGDIHRILCRGGIFIYPWDKRDPNKAGKLRLMYEGNPMAWIVEQAGGEAWTGKERILDVEPADIHQRVPAFLGAKNEVLHCIAMLGEAD